MQVELVNNIVKSANRQRESTRHLIAQDQHQRKEMKSIVPKIVKLIKSKDNVVLEMLVQK